MLLLYRKALIRHSIKPEPVTPRVTVSLERKEIHAEFQFANGAYNTLFIRKEEAQEFVKQLQLGIAAIDAP
jgi:hypothetical protein